MSTPNDPTRTQDPEATGPLALAPQEGTFLNAPGPGTVIAGKYTLSELIGEGGMGSVYLAQQTEPMKRSVAVKLIKSGADSKSVIVRFEAERQALALMDHPNIARIYDGGTTPMGSPFFVMELVQGVTLTHYCDAKRLNIPARLELFVTICQAVQHAHQKGIIHRDLKPGNVLVTEVDGKPVPKVIDFGVAKATEQKLTDVSFADTGFVIGTPTYMSPEQADPATLDIDTRTDVYALGVILYEMLTGAPPIEAKDFKRGAILEMLRVVREVEPPRPSTKLSLSDALPNIAANRAIEPAKLTQLLRGELDWVVMKALEKDRTRRYDSANGFAADVLRYLSGEAVLAHPQSRGYRLKKFLRQNRGPVLAASLVVLALIVGMSGTTIGLLEARTQRDAAKNSETLALTRLEQREKGVVLLGSVFKDLDPEAVEREGKPLSALLGERLEEATAQLEGDVIGDPLTVAKMQQTLGLSQLGLGNYPQAQLLLTKAHTTFTLLNGPAQRETLQCASDLALTLKALGKLDEAMRLNEETLQAREATLGPEHLDTLQSMNNLAECYFQRSEMRALTLFEKVLAVRTAKLGRDHFDTLVSMHNMAACYTNKRDYDAAIALWLETIQRRSAILGPDHARTLSTMDNLAITYQFAGMSDKALPLFEKVLERRRAKFGAEHPLTMRSLHALAYGYQKVGKYEQAITLYKETLEARKAKLGFDHPDTLALMVNLADAYGENHQLDIAIPLWEETLRLRKVKSGDDHVQTLEVMHGLAAAYRDVDKFDKALSLYEEALTRRDKILGPEHRNTLSTLFGLATTHHLAGNLEHSIHRFEELVRRQKNAAGPTHPDTLNAKANLAVNYRDIGRLSEALPLLEEVVRASAEHPKLHWARKQLLEAYRRANQPAKAVSLARELVVEAHQQLPKESLRLGDQLVQYGQTFVWARAWSDGAAVLRESLAISEKLEPNDWRTFRTKSLLGACLAGQKNYTDAEPLLVAGYEGIKQREATLKNQYKTQRAEALDRLVKLYEEWGKPEQAAEWRAKQASPR